MIVYEKVRELIASSNYFLFKNQRRLIRE